MLLSYFETLRRHGIPVSTREMLDCLGLIESGLARFSWEQFYSISRTCLVKDEKLYDRFDQAFQAFLSGVESIPELMALDSFEQTLASSLPLESLRPELHRLIAEYQSVEQAQNVEQMLRDSDSVDPGDKSADPTAGSESEFEKKEASSHQGSNGEDGEQGSDEEGELNEQGEEGEEGEEGESGEEGDDGSEGEKGHRGEKGQGNDGQEGEGESETGLTGSKETFELSSGKAIKLWNMRRFESLDEEVELGTRNLKVALRRIRKLARTGAEPELDLGTTIERTARNAGLLDIVEVPEKRNSVRVLLFLDVGGSMDEHITLTEQLFSAAKYEFKYLEIFYFHNFLYEKVWTDVQRREEDQFRTEEFARKYPLDYKVIFVGDANMGRHEITEKGGSVEHYNAVPGNVWLENLTNYFRRVVWLNPNPESVWSDIHTTVLIKRLLNDEMYPLNVAGIDMAARSLVK